MLYALINGEKTAANKNLAAHCPLCGNPVFARCGGTNIDHWAHYEDESCDKWSEPETEWHKNWKDIFGKEHSEVVINKNGKKHIADVFTSKEVVIEFQNSPISTTVIDAREAFYGEKMLWVLNGKGIDKKNFITFYYPDERSRTRIHVGHSAVNSNEGQEKNWSSDNNRDIKFQWNYARRVWMGAARHRFIDFGDAYLFMIEDWNAQKFGSGKWISKEKFVEKYGGDKSLLKRNQDTPVNTLSPND